MYHVPITNSKNSTYDFTASAYENPYQKNFYSHTINDIHSYIYFFSKSLSYCYEEAVYIDMINATNIKSNDEWIGATA